MRVAAWQCEPMPADVAGNLRRLEGAAARAAQAGAAVLVCPEMFLTGYNIGSAAVQRLAEPADGPSANAVATIAQRAGITIVYGYPERDASGAVFNAAQCIGAVGQRAGSHRKTHLFSGLDRAMFSAGKPTAALFELQGWRVGLQICYDIEFPENARRLALAGADLILVPTANMRDYDFVATTLVPTRAYENQLVVVYANYCGSEGEITYGGLSGVATPDGQLLARADREEALLIADIDLDALAASRVRHPYLADRVAALNPAS